MALLKDIIGIGNGARFLDADLHVHSYGGSHDVKDDAMTPAAIVDAAVRQSLSVIAITDHNTDVNVQRAVDHAAESYAGQILVLPGVEVTTAHGHLLTYFPPTSLPSLTKFLSRLDLIGDHGAENTRTSKSMADTIAEAEKLGGICIAAHIDREKTGFDAFAPGMQNWKRDILMSPGLYGLETDAADALVWYSDHDDQDSAGAERRKMLMARRTVPALSSRQHLAHLQGSDSHSMAEFEDQNPTKRWTRIKLAELSFSAVRTAFVDAAARVRARSTITSPVPRIRGLAVTGGFLHDERIHFSDNLNCFIGGRGTGKSTAIRSIAYAFGENEEFGEFDNCPDLVQVWCEDQNGVLYRYERTRGEPIEVKAKEDNAITDVPIDSFRIEYFGQGQLAKVAEDPLNRPELFQEFLDRHTNLRELIEREGSLLSALRENAARLAPLEVEAASLTPKKRLLREIEQKLKLAEEGNLREIVAIQSRLASERTVRESVEAIATEYTQGYTLANIQKDFGQIVATAGECTTDSVSTGAVAALTSLFARTNAVVKQKESELRDLLRECAKEIKTHVVTLKGSHQRLSLDIATKIADLKSRGLATDIPGLEGLLRQKTAVAKDVAGIEQRAKQLTDAREERTKLRESLAEVRSSMTARRKGLLSRINASLGEIIKDYLVFIRYDGAGITAEFEGFMRGAMHGTYLPDDAIKQVCEKVSPSTLAELVAAKDEKALEAALGLSGDWPAKFIAQLSPWPTLLRLQELAKPPKPIITVRTRSTPTRDIPVKQLSDGQRHTILLTVAMLAESNVPLVIDQPEDDLDNAFIFSSVVTTLRAVKERRQVILVTHNPNIAVLGDSELILPMYRHSDVGKAMHRGAIDSEETRRCVVDILEGGQGAFLRRKEMYGH